MNLGLQDKSAIVCGSDTDLGSACAAALAAEGARVWLAGEDDAALAQAAGGIGGDAACTAVVCDPTTDDGRQALLAACPAPDVLVNHAPGPPTGDFRQWSRDDWLRALDANMLAPIELTRLTLDGMIERGFGRIVNITSQAVKSPMADLDLSNAARSGLTGFVAGVARQARSADVTINNLLPGLFETRPLRRYIERKAQEDDTGEDAVARSLLGSNPLGRLGRPEEFGALCAFLASPHAGYINGQNILVDGGTFRSTL